MMNEIQPAITLAGTCNVASYSNWLHFKRTLNSILEIVTLDPDPLNSKGIRIGVGGMGELILEGYYNTGYHQSK
jgi:hypothetical protein